MIRYAFLILFALIIDGLQALCTAIFAIMGAAPGTVSGSAAAAFIAAKLSFGTFATGIIMAIGGLLGSILNPALVGFTAPLGVVMGMVMSVIISLTLGLVFIGVLAINHLFYRKYIFPAFIGETIPGLDFLPGWTGATVACVLTDATQQKLSASSLVQGATAVASVAPIGRAASAVLKTYAAADAINARSGTPTERGVPIKEPRQSRAPLMRDVRPNPQNARVPNTVY